MTAAEARAKAEAIRTDSASEQYRIIKGMILEATNKGELACCVYNTQIIPEVRKKLVNEGYKIEPVQDQRESYTSISW